MRRPENCTSKALDSMIKCAIWWGSHVEAKRYLIAIYLTYYNGLSFASKKSLEFQGGTFAGEELKEFGADFLRSEMISLRTWDDSAKIVGIEDSTPRAVEYTVLLEEHLLENGGQMDITETLQAGLINNHYITKSTEQYRLSLITNGLPQTLRHGSEKRRASPI